MRKLWKAAAAGVLSVFVMGTTVFAAPSVTQIGAVSQEFTIDGVKVEGAEAKITTDFSELALEPEVQQKIELLNTSPEKLQEVLEEILKDAELPEGFDIQTAKLLSNVQNLCIYGPDGKPLEDVKNVELTFEVPNMPSDGSADGFFVLHFSKVRGWEILKPKSVDFENKSMTVFFPDLSPVAVIYKDKESAGAEKSESESASASASAKDGETAPKTADTTPFALYALVLAGAALTVFGIRRTKVSK